MRPLDDPGSLNDISATASLRPTGVALACACGGADVQRLGARLAVEEARLGLPDGTLLILAFATQTPEAVLALPSYRGASARLAGLIVTPVPALLGAPQRLARDLAVIAARAAGVPVIDASFGDVGGLRAAALSARADGFDGMAALSVEQVGVVNSVFSS